MFLAISEAWLRSRVLKPGLIRLFFHPEQYFPLTNSYIFIQITPKFLQANGANRLLVRLRAATQETIKSWHLNHVKQGPNGSLN